MVFAVLLSAGWEVQASLERIIEARPIAAVLYASDALDWHHNRIGQRNTEVLRTERQLVERWVDERLTAAIAVVGRIRSTTTSDQSWRWIGRDELVEEMRSTASLTTTEALNVFDALEECIIDVFEAGDAVDFPGIGPIDAR